MSTEQHDLIKSVNVTKGELTDSDMELINAYTIEPLTKEEVFTFKLHMCDNDIDRDMEQITNDSLDKMKDLYVGKTVIKDHYPTVDNQIARIYATEVVSVDNKTNSVGEPYKYLQAKCFILKTESNADLIRDIKAGIKKECSVGFRVGAKKCSICGTNLYESYCKHIPGQEYNGAKCYHTLNDIEDAYEVSLVAVPAQREAGVVKAVKASQEEQPTPVVTTDDTEAKQAQLTLRIRLNDNETFIEEQGEINHD